MNFMAYLADLCNEGFIAPTPISGEIDFKALRNKLEDYGQFYQAEITDTWIERFDEIRKQEMACRPFDETIDALAPYTEEYIAHFSEPNEEGWIHFDSLEDFENFYKFFG